MRFPFFVGGWEGDDSKFAGKRVDARIFYRLIEAQTEKDGVRSKCVCVRGRAPPKYCRLVSPENVRLKGNNERRDMRFRV